MGPAILDASRGAVAVGYNPVIIETVGVGQVETGVVACCDVRVLIVTPLSGDYVQATKAGLTELVDVVVVNKADLPGASELASDLRRSLAHRPGREASVVRTVATSGESGIEEAHHAIDLAWVKLEEGALEERRLEAISTELLTRAAAAFACGPLSDATQNGVTAALAKSVLAGGITADSAAAELMRRAGRRFSSFAPVIRAE